MNKRTRVTAGAVLAAGLGSLAYQLFFRDWCLSWGARPDEVSRKLPGDELLAEPGIVTTRAIWIDAPAGSVWPWLVQMGPGRAGRTPTTGSRTCSASGCTARIRSFPGIRTSRSETRSSWGGAGRCCGWRCSSRNAPWCCAPTTVTGCGPSCSFPMGAWVRLISRNRIATPGAPLPVRLFNTLVMEPGSLIMERKMLLGIKERAERLAGE